MPPKKAAQIIPKKPKKAKFSATMPQFDDQSQQSSYQSQQNQSNFDQESNPNEDNSDEMELSKSSSSHEGQSQKKNTKTIPSNQESEQSDQDSQGSDEAQSKAEQSSSSFDKSDEQSFNQEKQPSKKPNQQKTSLKPSFEPILQASYISLQNPNTHRQGIAQPQFASQEEQIPQQQIQTDDFDSQSDIKPTAPNIRDNNNRSNEEKSEDQMIVEEKDEHPIKNGKEQESESKIYVPLNNHENNIEENKILQSQEVKQKKLPTKQQKKIIEQHQQNKEYEQPEHQGLGDNKKKKKSKKKSKKDKKKLQAEISLQEINQPPKDPLLNLQPIVQEYVAQQNKKQNISSGNLTDDEDSIDQVNLFYQVIYPYLTGIGQLIINDFVKAYKDKKKFTSLEALKWGRGISNTFLTKAFMTEVEGINHIEEDENDDQATKKQKLAIIDNKLNSDKFYHNVQKQLSQQNIAPVSFGEIYFLMKRFKLIASCLVIQKKRGEPIKANINTSCYWNKEKDGQINFSFEGESVFIMFTAYGLEIPKQTESSQ